MQATPERVVVGLAVPSRAAHTNGDCGGRRSTRRLDVPSRARAERHAESAHPRHAPAKPRVAVDPRSSSPASPARTPRPTPPRPHPPHPDPASTPSPTTPASPRPRPGPRDRDLARRAGPPRTTPEPTKADERSRVAPATS